MKAEKQHAFSWVDLLVASALVALSVIVLSPNVIRRYDFFDMAAFMDAGYRVYRGQEPFVDFFYVAGPVHLYMHALFYHLFGFTKTAVQAHVCTVSALVILMSYCIARKYLPIIFSTAATLITVFAFYGPVSHPWYDQNAYFWILAGVLIYEYFGRHERLRTQRFAAAICGSCVALAFMVKSNVGFAAVFLFFAVFAAEKRWALVKAYLIGGITAGALVLLTLQAPLSFFDQAFIQYKPILRLLRFERIIEVLRTVPYTKQIGFALVLAVLGGRTLWKKNISLIILCMGLPAIAFFSIWTASSLSTANISFVGVTAGYLLSLIWQLPRGKNFDLEQRVFYATTITASIMMMAWFASAVIKTKGVEVWNWRPSNYNDNYVMTNKPFRGWKCNPIFGKGFDAASEFINTNVPKKDSIFVFPGSASLYGVTGHESYRKAPFIFQLDHQPSPGHLYSEFREHFLKEPPKWIVFHQQEDLLALDVQAMLSWLKLDDFVKSNYTLVWNAHGASILKQKGLAP